jgi:hypothetical protein
MAIKKTTAVKKSDPPKKKYSPNRTMVTGPDGKLRYRYVEGGEGMGGIKKMQEIFLNPYTKAPMIGEMVRTQRTVKKAAPVKSNLLGVKSKKK